MSLPTKTGAKKTLAFGRVDEFLVCVHQKNAPTDEEWNAWLEFASPFMTKATGVRCLVVTEGGAPSPTQRQAMNKKLSSSKPPRTAIVTASPYVRGVVTAISWFSAGMSAFAPERMDDALTYLEAPQTIRSELRMLVKTLQAQVA